MAKPKNCSTLIQNHWTNYIALMFIGPKHDWYYATVHVSIMLSLALSNHEATNTKNFDSIVRYCTVD
jgi:hypothetical protein